MGFTVGAVVTWLAIDAFKAGDTGKGVWFIASLAIGIALDICKEIVSRR